MYITELLTRLRQSWGPSPLPDGRMSWLAKISPLDGGLDGVGDLDCERRLIE